MKPNSFGETIRRIEAERKSEAEAAVAAGWTEADHPHKCCPHLAVTTPQPKRAGRSLEDLQRLHEKAVNKAAWWGHAIDRAEAAIESSDAAKPRFDHGMLNLPLKARQRGKVGEQHRHKTLEHAKERAKHFAHLESKYAAQIEKRKS